MSNDKLLLEISDLLDAKLQPIHEEIRQVTARLDKVEMTLENNIIPRLQNIESCYTSTYDRYRIGIEKIDSLEKDVAILKRVVKEKLG